MFTVPLKFGVFRSQTINPAVTAVPFVIEHANVSLVPSPQTEAKKSVPPRDDRSSFHIADPLENCNSACRILKL